MKKYILGRFLRSLFSLFVVMSIVICLVYIFVPKDNAFKQDPQVSKLAGDKDRFANYYYSKLQDLGYLKYITQADMCALTDDPRACALTDSPKSKELIQEYMDRGYTVLRFTTGSLYAYREYTAFELILNFYKNLIKFDHPGRVEDLNNPDLPRKIYVEKGPNGIPAVACSGCENRYLLYVDGHFPFLHQNFFRFYLGKSFPNFSGLDTLQVITQGQGEYDYRETTYPTGLTQRSADNLYERKYKPSAIIDRLEKSKFDDNYVETPKFFKSPSMVTTSYTFGIISVILSYLISFPAGIAMARNKDKLVDKIGVIYINLMIAVPSLAFIFFLKGLGTELGLPDKFPIYGFGDIRSYILPMLILSLLGTAGLMIWVRRFTLDQASSDYVKFAKAKGLTQKEIFNRHIMKNAIIPLVNGIPATIILAIGGAVITETLFAIPGMGKMLPDAILLNNNGMIITLTFIFTALSIFSTLLGDLLMIVIDPRIQLSAKGDAR